jgi:phosphate transport system permease protein
MRLRTRHVLDKAFTGVGIVAIAVMALALVVVLAPIIFKGMGAFAFRGTVEYRRMQLELFKRGDRQAIEAEMAEARKARAPVFQAIADYEDQVGLGKLSRLEAELFQVEQKYRAITDRYNDTMGDERRALRSERRTIKRQRDDLEEQVETLRTEHKEDLARLESFLADLRTLFGPLPGEKELPISEHLRYGQTRWDRAKVKLHRVRFARYDGDGDGTIDDVDRREIFRGTPLEPVFDLIERDLEPMMRPKFTVYLRFLSDDSFDSHYFGGIKGELLGTIYLTIGAILFAVPMGVIAAIYLCEYARQGRVISVIRTCISTLAGVPSIVFGLFGLAFFLNTLHVSDNKSVLAGAMTLALMVLPTIIRASEEAILAVPRSYKEAAMGLGAGKWRTIVTVVLPASLPGILTGIVISMGRAAGETAPIIFTAAISQGAAIKIWQLLDKGTLALPWNIYNLCSENQYVAEIRHVQFGMVLTLVSVVLLLNVAAIVLRARVSKKLKG